MSTVGYELETLETKKQRDRYYLYFAKRVGYFPKFAR